MRHTPGCGAEISPGDALCSECFNVLVWSGDRLEGAAPPPAPPAEPLPAAAAPVACTCGRSHPADSPRPCVFGGTPIDSSPRRPEAAVSLPGGLRIPLGASPLVLGRMSDDERVGEALDDDYVSRRHASARFDGANVWIADAGSTHGTWVGDRRIVVEESLPPGDSRVVLGTRVTVIVHVP